MQLTNRLGAKLGANVTGHPPTPGCVQPQLSQAVATPGDAQPYLTTTQASMAWRGSGVRIPSAPPRNCRSEEPSDPLTIGVGAKLQASGMAEVTARTARPRPAKHAARARPTCPVPNTTCSRSSPIGDSGAAKASAGPMPAKPPGMVYVAAPQDNRYGDAVVCRLVRGVSVGIAAGRRTCRVSVGLAEGSGCPQCPAVPPVPGAPAGSPYSRVDRPPPAAWEGK